MNSQIEIVGTREGEIILQGRLSSWPQVIVSKGFVVVSEAMESEFLSPSL
jgi:hypothetical protein